MYDDASLYYSFNPSAQPQQEKSQLPKHKRKQSVLERPNEDNQADTGRVDRLVDGFEATQELVGPPEATLTRRAQSYSDFHDAVKAILGQDIPSEGAAREIAKDDANTEGKDITSELDFADWYNGLEHELLDSSHDDYTNYYKQLEMSQSHLDTLLLDTSSTLDLLASLTSSFKDVESQTTIFQRQCSGLLDEQTRITRLADNLDSNLKYYSYLEPVTRRLNAPGAEYMAAHPKQREAATYQSRYRSLMTRGLTLIRVHFVGALREIASDVSRRIADRQLNDTTNSALLYAKFRFGASELKEIAQEIRKRAVVPVGAEPGAEAEYQSLMNELYTSYSATRGRLVIPLARKKIADIALAPSTSKELVSFARSSIGYTRGVCSDEYELWREWFEGETGLYDFLESVCEPLYDHLRPRIIHETQLLKLCELCTLLQTRYIHDQDEEAEPMEADQFDFSLLIHTALEDAQTRLVFRAQAILRDEIERYKPKKEELDYPSRNRQVSLSGTKSQRPRATSGRKGSNAEPTTPMPKTPMVVEQSDSPNGRWGFDTEAAFQGWYPTLRKAIWLLSRIYRLVNSTVFDDLAHNIVHQTTNSLKHASTLVTQRTHNTSADGRLFLIKHLLVLKQQIVAFDIEYVTPDVSFDFSGVTNTFWELRERGGLFDPRNLWRIMGGGLLPKVVENMLDAKVELDGSLRTVINDLTSEFASRISKPVDASATAKKGFDAVQAVNVIQKIAEKEVPVLRRKLDEYLDDVRTKETLAAAVQDQVIQNYETFYDIYTAEKRSNGKQVSKKGKGRDDEAWDPDMFTEWAGSVFRVRNEIAVLKRVSMGHQNILTLVDYFETMNNLYLVTDLALGGELFDRICRKGSYYESDAADLIRATLSAVAYLHDHGIVHRDLKPENLLFRTPEDNADLLIADFGLSRIMDEEAFHVLTTTCGTPGYMAPEIFKKTGHGKPVDVWAIGVITYFLLCGYTPFDRDSNLEEMQAILVADYSFTPLEYWRSVSLSAREFIKRCLTIDPQQRMTAHEALSHPFVDEMARQQRGESAKGGGDLLPVIKKNFNARRTLHAAIDTIRAINKLREGGAAGLMEGAMSQQPKVKQQENGDERKLNDGNFTGQGGNRMEIDSRGNARGQTGEQIREQQRRVEETSRGLWGQAKG
ncbi:MAG: Golgi transport complex subunit 3 [Alectoria sarmentosa]|nr:MAG: Golgi transport complex subunit 3 [Alectoria sarmentosa]